MTNDLFTTRAGEARDALLELLAIAARTPSRQKVRGVVAELVEALNQVAMSGSGPAAADADMLILGIVGVSPEEAATMVGLSGRHVRRLCRAGLVRHSLLGSSGQYLVDVESLRDYLRAS